MTQRLDHLETECRTLRRDARRWRAGALALGAAAVALVCVGAMRDDGRAEVVAARRFVLKDDRDRSRAVLEVDAAGKAALAFLDSDGRERGRLGLRADGSPLLILTGAQTEAGLSLSVSGEGREETAQFSLFDRNGSGGVQIGVLPAGGPLVALHDSAGVARLSQELKPDGTPALKLLSDDQRGFTLGSFAVEENGGAALLLNDRDGNRRFRAPAR